MQRGIQAVLVTTILLSVPALHAQKAERTGGPERGTWGAEAAVGGLDVQGMGNSASLLSFLSPRVALVGGFAFSRTSVDHNTSLDGMTYRFDDAFSTVALQAGIRRYGRSGVGLRPIIGGGVTVQRTGIGGGSTTRTGGYAEAGAAWFFNPHVSLGAVGGVSALKGDSGWNVGGTLARLTGAVYF